MSIDAVLFLLPYILSATLSLWIGIQAWGRRSTSGSLLFAGIAIFETVWTVGCIAQMLTPELSGKLLWNNIQFLGAIGAPLAYFGFAVEYDQPAQKESSRFSWKVMIPVAVLVLAFVWSDGIHGKFRGPVFLTEGLFFDKLVFPNGPGFGIYAVYAYGLLALTTMLLLMRIFKSEPLYQLQVGIVLLGVLIPWFTSVITALSLVPVKLHEITPITFGISNLIISWAIFRYHLFEIVPVARDFLIENMREGVLVLGKDMRIVDINPAAQMILSAQKISAIGKTIYSYSPFEISWFDGLQKGESRKSEVTISRQGNPGFYEVQVTQLTYPHGEEAVFLVILRDIRDQKIIEEKLHHLAITDPLLSIHNRRHVIYRAEQEVERALQFGHDLSIILFDIDHFKLVNDNYGHQTGDQALEVLAQCVQSYLHNGDIFGRYGGEEFLVVLPETEIHTAGMVAERIRGKVEGLSVSYKGHEVRLTISLGAASLYGCGTHNLDYLLERADEALYQAKALGRNQVCLPAESWASATKED